MTRPFLPLIAASLLLAHSFSADAQRSRTAGASDNGPVKDQETVMALLYQQRAAEYKALCLQAYHLAALKVEAALRHEVLDKDDKPLAVVTDLDETVLDNSVFQVNFYRTQKPVKFEDLLQWWKQEQADTVPGSVEFFQYVDNLKDSKGRKIDIYYISNRDTSVVTNAINNMSRFRFPQLNDSNFKFARPMESSKERRRQEVLQNHRIIVLLGDNLGDHDQAFDDPQASSEDRSNRVDQLHDKWGDLYVVLPNAVYGGWETALYSQFRQTHNGRSPATPAEKIQARDEMLKPPATTTH